MKKIVKILLISIVVIILSGCTFQIFKSTGTGNTMNQTTGQISEINYDTIIEYQNNCVTQSAKLFEQQGYDSIKYADFYDYHWNKTENICFILIQSTRSDRNKSTTSKLLIDVFGNNIFGKYVITNYYNKDETKLDCEMYEYGTQESFQSCKSQTEFDNFVKPFMEE